MTLQCGWLAGVWPGLVLNSQGQGQGPGYPKVRVRVQGIQGSGSRVSQGQGPGYPRVKVQGIQGSGSRVPKVRVRVQGIQGSGSRISAGRLGKPWIDNLIWIYNCIPVHVCKLGPIVYQFMFRTLIVLSIEYRR